VSDDIESPLTYISELDTSSSSRDGVSSSIDDSIEEPSSYSELDSSKEVSSAEKESSSTLISELDKSSEAISWLSPSTDDSTESSSYSELG